jgi:hypothetical protein
MGALLSLGGPIFGASQAGGAQVGAEQNAIKTLEQMFGIAQGQLSPYAAAGTASEGKLLELLGIGPNNIGSSYGSLTKPFNPTMGQLEGTPGYQFALQQGLEATQNSFAGQGLGGSGNAARGAANYAEGLASTTYQQQFQNDLAQKAQIASLLLGPTQIGAGAAGNLANSALGFGGDIAQSQVGIGNAQAGMWNTIGGSIGGLGNTMMQMAMMSQLFGGGGGGMYGNVAAPPMPG